MLNLSTAILSESVNQISTGTMNPLFPSLNYFASNLLDYLEFKREESRFERDESDACTEEDAISATAYHNGRFDAFNEILSMLSELRQLDKLNASD